MDVLSFEVSAVSFELVLLTENPTPAEYRAVPPSILAEAPIVLTNRVADDIIFY